MHQVKSIEELREHRDLLKGEIGLVPTMGFLHEGHMDLIRKSKNYCDRTIVSIFINPTQFGPNEDLETYPRDLEKDFSILNEEGVDLVWLPDNSNMYPEGYQTWVEVVDVTKPLEGSMRSEHFKGVTTIVAKLFNCVQPDKAFFGQKDAQQVAVIKQMVNDLNFPLEIIVVPTSREIDGLARSSRNVKLSAEERKAAPVLYKALEYANIAFQKGERSASKIRKILSSLIEKEPSAQIQYVSCANPTTLMELDSIDAEGALISMAIYFGKTRLIDNMLLSE